MSTSDSKFRMNGEQFTMHLGVPSSTCLDDQLRDLQARALQIVQLQYECVDDVIYKGKAVELVHDRLSVDSTAVFRGIFEAYAVLPFEDRPNLWFVVSESN